MHALYVHTLCHSSTCAIASHLYMALGFYMLTPYSQQYHKSGQVCTYSHLVMVFSEVYLQESTEAASAHTQNAAARVLTKMKKHIPPILCTGYQSVIEWTLSHCCE